MKIVNESLIKANALNGYKELTASDDLPEFVVKMLEEHGAFDYPGNWYYDDTYIRDNTDFIVTMDNGYYYKVDAQFMIWYYIDGQFGSKASWSNKSLQKMLKSLIKTGKTDRDPLYQS